MYEFVFIYNYKELEHKIFTRLPVHFLQKKQIQHFIYSMFLCYIYYTLIKRTMLNICVQIFFFVFSFYTFRKYIVSSRYSFKSQAIIYFFSISCSFTLKLVIILIAKADVSSTYEVKIKHYMIKANLYIRLNENRSIYIYIYRHINIRFIVRYTEY